MSNELPVQVSLQEFCMTLSSTDRRVEMIGAFEFDERGHGRYVDAVENYKSRYILFCDKPVK